MNLGLMYHKLSRESGKEGLFQITCFRDGAARIASQRWFELKGEDHDPSTGLESRITSTFLLISLFLSPVSNGLLTRSHSEGSPMEIALSASQPVAASSFQRVAESSSLKLKNRSRLTSPAAPFEDSK